MLYYRVIGKDRKTHERCEILIKDPETDIMKIWRRFAKVTRLKLISIERVETDVSE